MVDDTDIGNPGKELFHKLMKEAPVSKDKLRYPEKDRLAGIAKVNSEYAKLSPEERLEFFKEAKSYIAQNNLASHLDHPRTNAGVFVYQAAVLEEVREIDAKLKGALGDRFDVLVKDADQKNKANPKAHAFWADGLTMDDMAKLTPNERGIAKSESYHDFKIYTSTIDKHEHPDGLYGPVTHKLNSRPIEDLIKLERVPIKIEMPLVDLPKYTPPELKLRELPKVPEPEPVVKKEEPKKNETNVILSRTENFNHNANMYEGAKGPDGTIYKSPSDAKERLSVTDLTVEHKIIGKTVDKVFSAGVTNTHLNVKDANNTVDLTTNTGQPGTPAYTQQTGTYTGKPEKLATLDANTVHVGVEGQFHLGNNNKVPPVIVGGHVAAGVVKTHIFNTDIQNSGLPLNGYQPLPSSSQRTNFAFGYGGKLGLGEGKVLPGVMLTGDYLSAGDSGHMTNFSLSAFKNLNLTKDGKLQLGLQAGVNQTNSSLHHDGNTTQTITVPDRPNLPGGTYTVTNSDYNSAQQDGHGLGVSGQVSLKFKLGKDGGTHR